MGSQQETEFIAGVTRELREGLTGRLVALVLFGSKARDDGGEHSDWDLLLVANNLPPDLFERRIFLKRLLSPGHRGRVSILARTPQEFENHVSSLCLDIATDGRILYERQGYAANRLGALRSAMRKAGFVRHRTAAGDTWQSPGGWAGLHGFRWAG